jgi:heme oxygenase
MDDVEVAEAGLKKAEWGMDQKRGFGHRASLGNLASEGNVTAPMTIAIEAPAAARLALRDACGDIHARLDARLSGFDFDDRDAYAEMLSRMSGPVSAMESALSAGIAPALFVNWAGRLRAHALRADLEALGGDFCDRRAPAIETEAEALGTLYVLEGSRLGGRVLARMAGESRDAAVRSATRYFSHGMRDGLWRAFLETLEQSRAAQVRREELKRSALAAFAEFEAAFE